MNISEPFIRRPVMTVLLSASFVVAGAIAYSDIPIAALPHFDTPTIQVSASLPGASPEDMATSVATPLEKQFATIAGVAVTTSTSTQGRTSVTLEFDQDRDIDKAAVDVQAALFRAQRGLPEEMTNQPSYRKVNPALSALPGWAPPCHWRCCAARVPRSRTSPATGARPRCRTAP